MTKTAQTLSVVVPVHNAERTLRRQIIELLDVLPELVSWFEIMIVDDGSTDQTDEIAHDLARDYPQVHVTRHPERRGLEASAETGVAHTSGDVVIVQAGGHPVRTTQLQRMWKLRDDEQLVVAQCGGRHGSIEAGLLRKLIAWGNGLDDESLEYADAGGIQMLRRSDKSRSPVRKPSHVPTPTLRFSSANSRTTV